MKPPHPPHPTEASDVQNLPNVAESPTAPDLRFALSDTSHCLSALMDGQAWAVPEAIRQWREDDEARKTWHVYHLIGDVLRSDELARPAAHDLRFLQALNKRLASEPVVLAPPATGHLAVAAASAAAAAACAAVVELPQVRPPVPVRKRWLKPAAALAGIVGVAGMAVVAGVLVIGRPGLNGPSAVPALAAAPAAAAGPDRVIRDPRLEEFLRAHQAARSGVAAGVPGSALRSVGTVVPVAAGQ